MVWLPVARMTYMHTFVHLVWMVPLNLPSRKTKVLWTQIVLFFWIIIDPATTLSVGSENWF